MRIRVVILLAAIAALTVPAHALADDLPDVVNDPPAAFDGATAATVDLGDVPAAPAAAPSQPAAATPPATHASSPAPAPVRAASAAPARAPLAELPFTGSTQDTVAAVLLGIVLILAGIALRALPTERVATSESSA